MFRKPVFWIVITLISIASVIFTFKYFSRAFPIVNLDLQMDRQQALQSAQDLAQKYDWGPEGFRQAASFALESEVQNFVELEAGGTDAFNKLLKEGLYSPYTWRVRHFKAGETNETLIRFTPQGQPYGFVETLPEDEPGASLTADSARVIAERGAANDWQVDLAAYELAEKSQELHPGGRTDHTFVYERPNVQIGEGRYRMRLVVGGDRLTELTHFIKIPEAFSRRFEELRSANNTIASTAIIAVGVLYVLGGCIIGLFFLLRQRWVVWRKALFWGIFIALLVALAGINQLPLAWMDYDTALSTQGFLLQQIFQLLATFIFLSALMALSFIAAESLSRKAFPHHIQHWRLWSSEAASSPSILGRTMSGYLLVAVFLAYDVALYFFATRVLGWWTPSEALFQPDVLATYFPWLTSIAISAQAGFWEECLFRAVPIAGAALIGQRFGGRRAWIIAAFIIQALIFGAAHANYPNQPAYARLVELIIPSLGFGALYYYFGLLPAIILHYAVDVVYIALPLFVSSAPGIWVDQTLVVLLMFVPLWVIIRGRLKTKRWGELTEEYYNCSWSPPAKVEPEPVVTKIEEKAVLSTTTSRLLMVGGVLGLIIWLFASNFQNQAPPLTIGRKHVKELARKTLTERGIELPETWQILSSVQAEPGQQDRFVWQIGDKENYENLMGHYLSPPQWNIRFVQFTGDVAERAEEYQVFIANDGEIIRIRHQLPEARPGLRLSEDEARVIAHSVLTEKYQLNPSELKEVSAVASKLPNRRDWVFTFADTLNYPLSEGEARISVEIAGDEVVDAYQFVHVPEEWARQERNDRNLTNTIQAFCVVLVVVMILAGIIGAIVSWSRKKFSVAVFLSFFALLFGLRIIALINNWPSTLAQFSTAEPLSNQTFTAIAFSVLGSLFLAGGFALIVGFIQIWKSEQSPVQSSKAVLLGLSLGTLIVGILSLIAKFAPSLAPNWANYSAASTYLPFLGAGMAPIEQYILRTTSFLFIFVAVDRFTKSWSQRQGLFSIVLISSGLILTGVTGVTDVPYWLLSGFISGAIMLLAYQFVLRFHLVLIPLAVGTFAMLSVIKQGVLKAYPDAIPGAFLAIIFIGLISFCWFRKLDTQQS
ncbi:MAG: CPBP family intramembrane glutamic endopeptidase [bacterium]